MDHLDAPDTTYDGSGKPGTFWPNGIRLVITVSLMYEAAGRPAQTLPTPTPGMFKEPFPGIPMGGSPPPGSPVYPDLPGETYLAYGYREGVRRLLDVFDRRRIAVTSFMVGEAVDRTPDLAREVVERGHEAAAHGRTHEAQYQLSRDDERAFIADGAASIERVTGVKPTGYNCWALARSVNTASLLQELGFTYHIDDVSRDEPFVELVNGKPFAIVPYTKHLNDFELFSIAGNGIPDYERLLRYEFDVLYAEAATRRRMMVVTAHDRVAGRPARARALDNFIGYAQTFPGVAFMKKNDIAKFMLGVSGASATGAAPAALESP